MTSIHIYANLWNLWLNVCALLPTNPGLTPMATQPWAARDNTTIRELKPFADAFLNPLHIGTMIGKYGVSTESGAICQSCGEQNHGIVY